MTLQRLVFRKSQKALCARLDQADDLAAAIDELDLPRPRPVIVLVGGAGGGLHRGDDERRVLFLACRPSHPRTGEARAFRWEDVDLKNDRVIIRAGFDL